MRFLRHAVHILSPAADLRWCTCRTIYATLSKARDVKEKPRSVAQLQLRQSRSFCSQNPEEDIPVPDKFGLPTPDLDWEYLLDPENAEKIEQNVKNRKGVGDIRKVLQLKESLDDQDMEDFETVKKLRLEILKEAAAIPNFSHSESPVGDESKANLVETIGTLRDFEGFTPRTHEEIGEYLNILRTKDLGQTAGHRSYYLMGEGAMLERALLRYTLDNLDKKGFQLVSIPDLVHPEILEGCGFKTDGERNQVYKLDPEKHDKLCLVGTAEQSLAGMSINEVIKEEHLPLRWMAVSRCYRAETGMSPGIYRVHQFNKVEMFAITANETGQESQEMLSSFVDIQKELFQNIGLHFRVLEMPTEELGAPAYRKFDIEAWMPGSSTWGEISSASNCTDYQSRRLYIRYENKAGEVKHVHTVNGTACAAPRMIIALLENNQNKNSTVTIPTGLQKFLFGREVLRRPKKGVKYRFNKTFWATDTKI